MFEWATQAPEDRVVEPPDYKKSFGFNMNEPLPSRWLNWFWKTATTKISTLEAITDTLQQWRSSASVSVSDLQQSVEDLETWKEEKQTQIEQLLETTGSLQDWQQNEAPKLRARAYAHFDGRNYNGANTHNPLDGEGLILEDSHNISSARVSTSGRVAYYRFAFSESVESPLVIVQARWSPTRMFIWGVSDGGGITVVDENTITVAAIAYRPAEHIGEGFPDHIDCYSGLIVAAL